ncbi:MAG: RNA chaperone Hfq [candidate division NC10 bacterium]|nr:RNA chaperone Hfq [candidate division NC10 bacterium]
MGKVGDNLQDVFLNQVRREKTPVTIYLTNGFQLKGRVLGFDAFTVILLSDGRQLMIYKHAISTISPLKPLGEADFLPGKAPEPKGKEPKSGQEPQESFVEEG